MAEIGYSGLKGTNLPGIGHSLDELSSKYYSMGSALLNPTILNGIPMTVGQSLRPYPFYSNFSDTAEFYAHSNYNSLQAKLVKRFGSGGTLSANYTWSKNLGNTDTLNGYPGSQAICADLDQWRRHDPGLQQLERRILAPQLQRESASGDRLRAGPAVWQGAEIRQQACVASCHAGLRLERERNHDLPVRIPAVSHRGAIQSIDAVLRRWRSPPERGTRLQEEDLWFSRKPPE